MRLARESEMDDLVKRLNIKAGVMEMGERIAWGSDTALMREAADEIEQLRAQLADLDHQCVMIGTTLDSYDSTKEAINSVIDWNVAAALDPKVNGGKVLVAKAQSGDAFAIGYFDSYGNLTEWKSCDIKAEYLPKNCAEFLYTSPPAAKVLAPKPSKFITDSDDLVVGELYWLRSKTSGHVEACRCEIRSGVKHFNNLWTDNKNPQGFNRWDIAKVGNIEAMLSAQGDNK